MSSTLGQIIGTDRVVPVYNPDETWRVWNIDDIYLGREGKKKYIPKPNDLVMEIVGAKIIRWIVKSINWENGVAQLIAEESSTHQSTFIETDVLVGLNGSAGLSTYLCYVDKTHLPYRLSVDQRLYVPGSMVKKCKIFKGNLLTTDGVVVSRVYDTNNVLSQDYVSMEKAGVIQISDMPVVENYTIQTVKSCYTNADLKSGEFLTAVFFSDEGFVVHKQQLVVEETSFIAGPATSKKYITGISVRSPFIKTDQERVIRFPLNVPLAALNLIGTVHYSNGDKIDYPIDGRKFKVIGFENYVATQPGQRFPVVISYALSPTEGTQSAVVGSGKHISINFEAITLPVDGTYGVKLFCAPLWIDSVQGYKLNWYLYNLNRNLVLDVTPYVIINSAIKPYNPTLYGVMQNLSVSLNLKKALPHYNDFIHTQSIGIVIESQGTERRTNWTITYTPGQSPVYGTNVYCGAYFLSTNRFRINLNSGCLGVDEWISKIYKATQPLTNPLTEASFLVPTHFQVVIGETILEYPIEKWNKDLIINRDIKNSSTLIVRFVRRLVNGHDLQLSCGGFPVYYTTESGEVITS